MKKEKTWQLAHLLAGLIVLIQVFDWFENKQTSFTTNFLVVGCAFLVVAGAHKWVQKFFSGADSAFLLLESSTFFYSAWLYKEEGSRFAWLAGGLVGVVYLAFAIYNIVTTFFEGRQRSSRRRRRRKRTK